MSLRTSNNVFYFRVHPALEEMTVFPANQDLRYVSACLLYLFAVNRASYVTLLLFQGETGPRGFTGSDGDTGEKV